MPKKQKQRDMEIVGAAAQMADIPPEEPKEQPFLITLGGDKFVSWTEWNGTKRVDIRRWKDGKVPTKDGASLYLD